MKSDTTTFNMQGDTLRIGADFFTLQDKTVSTIEADTLADFTEVSKNHKTEDHRLILGGNQIQLRAKEVDRYSKPLVSCVLNDTGVLQNLAAANGKSMRLHEFASFMDQMKRFTDEKGLEMLASLRHFKLKKLMDVEASDDRKGNVSYKFTLESSGKDDFTPPDSVAFKVPVFKHHPDSLEHSFELFMDVKHAQEGPEVVFTLRSFDMMEMVETRKREIINAGVTSLEHEKVWGRQVTHVQSDDWVYKPNPDTSH